MQPGKHLMEVYTLPFIKYPSNTISHKDFIAIPPVLSSYFSSLPFSFRFSFSLLYRISKVFLFLCFFFSLSITSYHVLS